MAEAKEMLTQEQFESYFRGKKEARDTFFRPGYLFNPCLFGKFMDPSEPFPLWNHTPYDVWPSDTVALSRLRLNWTQANGSIVLCAVLPDMKKEDIDVAVEQGRILKINGRWKATGGEKEEGEGSKKEFVRKFLLPENANIERARARLDERLLDITIPKIKFQKSQRSREKSRTPPPFYKVEVTD
eukprot:TRINITY_DN7072_c0_g1_i3.p1 TRINITY_DN7072_c0_g1~~TRINITY_DN7072_c0_g1_i3.p1  ORF type:complete len:185 (+),score=40.18 TRINITY_DN7072_c0_g1_i3:128-682(+)